MSYEELSIEERATEMGSGTYRYSQEIIMTFTNRYEEICEYPALVDLAHKID